MDDAKYLRYAELEAQKKSIEAEQAEIKAGISSEFESLGLEKLETPIGTFYTMVRKLWTYPAKVLEIEKLAKTQIAEAKKEAEASGEATFEENKSMAFRAKVDKIEGSNESAEL